MEQIKINWGFHRNEIEFFGKKNGEKIFEFLFAISLGDLVGGHSHHQTHDVRPDVNKSQIYI